jgi:hypothetical protein
MPYSLHAYQYAYSNPVMWTDPSGECAHLLESDPTGRAYIQCELKKTFQPVIDVWEGSAAPLAQEYGDDATSIGIDFVPVIGDGKGIVEAFTGCDLVTGEELGHWRWLGLAGFVGLAELRQLRHADVARPALNRLQNHFKDAPASATCYECVLNTLHAERFPYEDMRFMTGHEVIPALQELGFRQAGDLQPGDVIVWLAGGRDFRKYPDDFDAGFAEDAASHIGIYLGDYNGKRTILSGNWPPGQPAGMYDMDVLLRMPSRVDKKGNATGDAKFLSNMHMRYYRLPDE